MRWRDLRVDSSKWDIEKPITTKTIIDKINNLISFYIKNVFVLSQPFYRFPLLHPDQNGPAAIPHPFMRRYECAGVVLSTVARRFNRSSLKIQEIYRVLLSLIENDQLINLCTR